MGLGIGLAAGKIFIKDSRPVYSGTSLKWLPMGHKFVAVMERWLLMEVQMYAK